MEVLKGLRVSRPLDTTFETRSCRKHLNLGRRPSNYVTFERNISPYLGRLSNSRKISSWTYNIWIAFSITNLGNPKWTLANCANSAHQVRDPDEHKENIESSFCSQYSGGSLAGSSCMLLFSLDLRWLEYAHVDFRNQELPRYPRADLDITSPGIRTYHILRIAPYPVFEPRNQRLSPRIPIYYHPKVYLNIWG